MDSNGSYRWSPEDKKSAAGDFKKLGKLVVIALVLVVLVVGVLTCGRQAAGRGDHLR